MGKSKCISGAAAGSRCDRDAADGFHYCPECGANLGAFYLQCPGERDRMDAERAADALAARVQLRPKKHRRPR